MKKLITFISLSFFAIASFSAQNKNVNDVTVVVTNFETNKGKAFVALYDSEDTFLNKGFKSVISAVENNTCTVVFKDVPNGVYAISMFHDANDNNKMDTTIFGIPKEDYGCSNNATGFMGPPKWEDAKFIVNNKSITQNISL